jgi:hypothetical protein
MQQWPLDASACKGSIIDVSFDAFVLVRLQLDYQGNV